MNILEAKIYVGTYAKYNNGSIFGSWLDLADYSSIEEFHKACVELHEDEEDPEFMFQDYENIPESLVSESELSPEVFEIIEAIKDYDEDRQEALMDFINNDPSSDSIIDAISSFEDVYQGQFSSETAFAEQLVDDCYDLEKTMGDLARYFDYDSFARDLFCSDYWMSDNGHVFRNC